MDNSQVRFQDIPYSLENGVREKMLQHEYAKALVILEGLYGLKFAGGAWLTFQELYRLLRDNFGMSYQLVYQGLQAKLVFQRRKSESVAYQRGARPYLYRVPCPEELKAEFAPDLNPTPSDPLMRTDLRTVSAYKLGLHRELYYRLWTANGGHGFQMYRELQAERLNVSVRTVRNYDKLLGFSHEANYIEREITNEDWQTLPRYKEKFDKSGKRLASRQWLKVLDRATREIEILPHVRYLAYINLREQKAVYEVKRTANTYYPYRLPEKRDLRDYDYDPVNPYLADLKARNEAGLYQKNDGSWYHPRRDEFGSWRASGETWYYRRE